MPDHIVSIIIPSFNSAATLDQTLASVVRQQGDWVREVIVVDSSTDECSATIAERYAAFGVRLLRSGVRVIAARQRNLGARAATGELLLFLDADVVLPPSYVRIIVEAFRSGVRAGFGSVDMSPSQRARPVAIAQYYAQLSEYIPRGVRRTKRLILGCSNFCDRRLFERVGGYPEMNASEDVAYGRALAGLTRIWFLPDAVVAHLFRSGLRPFFRHERLLGTYVAHQRLASSRPRWLRGRIPALFAPLFFLSKVYRIFARVLAGGPTHLLRMLFVSPILLCGVAFWTRGFVEGASQRSGR